MTLSGMSAAVASAVRAAALAATDDELVYAERGRDGLDVGHRVRDAAAGVARRLAVAGTVIRQAAKPVARIDCPGPASR